MIRFYNAIKIVVYGLPYAPTCRAPFSEYHLPFGVFTVLLANREEHSLLPMSLLTLYPALYKEHTCFLMGVWKKGIPPKTNYAQDPRVFQYLLAHGPECYTS